MNKTKMLQFGKGAIAAVAVAAVVILTFAPGHDLGGVVYAQSSPLEDLQSSFRAVADKVLPTVVEVNVVEVVTQTTGNAFPFSFGQPSQPQQRQFQREGLGSGVIFARENGKVYVLTNYHVAGTAQEISVSLYDKRKFNAKLVGTDERRDLAVLVIETREEVPIAELGDSDTLRVGDWVLAVGNPLGFESTLTAGIVSAKGRRPIAGSGQVSLTDYIQTDAAINQGNSGGALVNIRGEVVGINTWIASPSGGSIGLGFAIPIDVVKRTIDDILTKGEVQYGWLGVTIGDLPVDVATDLGIDGATGGFVFGVVNGSPADRAGIFPGDYITVVDGQDMDDSNHVTMVIGNFRPNDEVPFTVLRNGAQEDLSVRIAKRDDSAAGNASNTVWPGLVVMKITDDIRSRLNVAENAGDLVVVSVDEKSPAGRAGFKSGDVIAEINGQKVSSVRDFYRVINGDADRQLPFEVNRQGSDLTLRIAA